MTKDNSKLSKQQAARINKSNRNISGNLNTLMDELSVMTYGNPRTDKIDSLSNVFKSLLKSEMDSLTKRGNGDITSFISQVLSDNSKRISTGFKEIENIFNSNNGQLEAFMTEQYRNRLVKQADLHEVSSQLIELQQAIAITRDAIISANIVDGHMSRTLKFDAESEGTDGNEFIPMVEQMEKTFKLQKKIKNFIIPRTLEYGEYYAYCVPYSKLFEDFSKDKMGSKGQYVQYAESVKGKTLFECMTETSKKELNSVITESVKNYKNSPVGKANFGNVKNSTIDDELKAYMENIVISNDAIPLCVLDEGIESYKEYYSEFVEKTVTEKNEFSFSKVMAGINDSGLHLISNNTGKAKPKKVGESFHNISDCYLRLIDPMHILPIKIMDEVIGYYYIQEEDITPLAGILTSTMYYDKYDTNVNANNIIASIAESIVASFDKKFLEKNMKFKRLIVEALNYFKLNNRKLRFQFIPKEYIVEFKVNEDERGDGTSVIEPSLFYAKLYLMTLLFKFMTIILNSNDTKVHYVKQAGIEMDIANKIEEIIRMNQQRQITLADMFSYTTLVNKIGQGNDKYIPVGSSGERGIETEILSGQDVQINNEWMENLKKSYIAGTGVPDVLMNYINEADFAKTLELANNRFQGLVVSYQLDFNEQITTLYKQMMRYSTNVPESIIETFSFNFLQPESSNANITNDLINNHNALEEFLVLKYFGDINSIDDPKITKQVQLFRKLLAVERLPMLKWEKLELLFKQARTEGTADYLHDANSEDNTETEDNSNDNEQ